VGSPILNHRRHSTWTALVKLFCRVRSPLLPAYRLVAPSVTKMFQFTVVSSRVPATTASGHGRKHASLVSSRSFPSRILTLPVGSFAPLYFVRYRGWRLVRLVPRNSRRAHLEPSTQHYLSIAIHRMALQAARIELTILAWKARMLPLHYTCYKWIYRTYRRQSMIVIPCRK
jgi:hypothetical protein